MSFLETQNASDMNLINCLMILDKNISQSSSNLDVIEHLTPSGHEKCPWGSQFKIFQKFKKTGIWRFTLAFLMQSFMKLWCIVSELRCATDRQTDRRTRLILIFHFVKPKWNKNEIYGYLPHFLSFCHEILTKVIPHITKRIHSSNITNMNVSIIML